MMRLLYERRRDKRAAISAHHTSMNALSYPITEVLAIESKARKVIHILLLVEWIKLYHISGAKGT
jgi:hypothetical protein